MAADRDPHRLDAMEVRRAFERAATTYDDAAVLQREIGARMAERLGFVKLDVSMILDAGCGTGIALGELAARYPDASVFGVDLAYAMTRAAQKRCASAAPAARGLLGRLLGSLAPSPGDAPRLICGDIVHLPLRSGAFDLVWSNLTLQWINEPEQAIADVHRVLRVGGLFSFTTFGPDTLKELRAAFAAADGAPHVSRFVDMHDIGDMLVQAGFADPVMDMETITLTYADAASMMHDLKALGAHNATSGRLRGLTGRGRWQRMLTALEANRRDGHLPASFEVVYGHAWKPEPRISADGRAIVRIERSRKP